MSIYESLAARLIGTPLQRPAEWARHAKGAWHRRRHPELAEWFAEGGRVDACMSRVIAEDTNCLDIGCHIGSFLQKLVTMAPRGQHHAFEPVPHKAQWLASRFPMVSVHAVALSDQHTTAEFFVNPRQTSYSGLVARRACGPLEPIAVQCRTLDETMRGNARIGFVKIDVNGAESKLLRGAREFLQRDRPFVLLECTREGLDDYGVHSDEVFDLVTGDLGWRLLLLKDWLADGPALDAEAFGKSMDYPFQAFNFALVAPPPRTTAG